MPFQPPPGEIRERAIERFAAFVATRVNPGAQKRDDRQKPVPRRLMREAAELGLLGYNLPEEVGGEGRDPFCWGITLETLGGIAAEGSFPLLVSLLPSVAWTFYDTGRSDLIDRYVRPMVKGRKFGAWSYTEGADPFSFKSIATKTDRGWLVNGKKSLITGGQLADVIVVYVGDGQGDLMCFAIERNDPGVEIIPAPVLGVRSSGLASMKMTNVELPKERLLVETDGLSHAQAYLNKRRALLTSPIVGAMETVLDLVVHHLSGSERFLAPLTEYSNVQASIGRMHILVETCRTVLYRALDRLRWEGTDPSWDPQVSVAKYYIASQAIDLGVRAMRLVGTSGYLRGVFERYLRDALSLIAGAGTQDILEVHLGMELIDKASQGEAFG